MEEENKQAKISMYDYSKQIIANEVPMPEDALKNKISELTTYVRSCKYCMLLNRERYDFTIFKSVGRSMVYSQNEILETLTNRGAILVADKQADGAYEIWIRDTETNENFAYYLFNYDNGIVEV